LLAVFGMVLFLIDNIRLLELKLNYSLLVSTVIASLFSVICLYSADFNIVDDYSYATYIVSFFVWLFGAYSVAWFFRFFYGEFTFRQLVFYVLSVCVVQCFLALIIHNVPEFKNLVNSVVLQGQDFLEKINRLYGIGAALDNAGVRFSIVLILTANLLINDEYVREKPLIYFLILISFFIVGIIGNMISRTSVIGFGFGLAYIIFYSGVFKKIIEYKSFRSSLIFIAVLVIIVFFAFYIYKTSIEYRENLRFAFEGFFNWYEKGEWRTSSTDKLNKEMWIWPQDTKTWIIGSGIFGNFVYNTDVGYCRFILYSGIIGFLTFASLFIYNSIIFMIKVPQYRMMFFMFGLLPFIIWLKVATDIFFIFALFYCIDSFSTTYKKKTNLNSSHETRV